MNETTFWHYLRERMLGHWEADRIENLCGSGTPDVTFTVPSKHGWIELKYLENFPKRPTTKVKIACFTDQQKLWLTRRGRLAGDCWLFVRVGKEMFLFSWDQVYSVEEWTQAEWRDNACFMTRVGSFNGLKLYKTLNGPV